MPGPPWFAADGGEAFTARDGAAAALKARERRRPSGTRPAAAAAMALEGEEEAGWGEEAALWCPEAIAAEIDRGDSDWVAASPRLLGWGEEAALRSPVGADAHRGDSNADWVAANSPRQLPPLRGRRGAARRRSVAAAERILARERGDGTGPRHKGLMPKVVVYRAGGTPYNRKQGACVSKRAKEGRPVLGPAGSVAAAPGGLPPQGKLKRRAKLDPGRMGRARPGGALSNEVRAHFSSSLFDFR